MSGIVIEIHCYCTDTSHNTTYTMARLVVLFSLLSAFVYAVDVQNTSPRDPQCVVNVNVPERGCDQTSCYGADEHCVKKGSLQDIRKELATIKSGIAKLLSKTHECRATHFLLC